jgi:N-acetyl-gamma-glutamyl-phosphate reductase
MLRAEHEHEHEHEREEHMVKVGIVGATAYTSLELIKILARHPEARIVHLGGRRDGSPLISDVFTSLKGVCQLPLLGLYPDDAPEQPDVAFFCLPAGTAAELVSEYLDAGVRCIDFSADYRFDDLALYEAWYGEHKDPENVARAVYGIPELFRDQIAGAELVANPGCYPTGVAIGLTPLVRAGIADPSDITVDAKSGVSGRGNKPSEGSMFMECNEDVRAYGVTGHRHEPEMERALWLATGKSVNVTFIPNLVPMDRGILAVSVAPMLRPADDAELQAVLEEAYAGEPFVRVRTAEGQPRTKDVANTNYCDVAAVARKGRKVIVTSAIDNLMKGASSQAVQNMNVMFGLKETLGLL